MFVHICEKRSQFGLGYKRHNPLILVYESQAVGRELSAVGRELSAVGGELSAESCRLSAESRQALKPWQH